MRATGGQAERRTGSPSGGPLNLIHTTKSPNPRPARVSARLTPEISTFQALHLRRLESEFDVDISGAVGLSGPTLDEWIHRAEDELATRLIQEYKASRGVNAKT